MRFSDEKYRKAFPREDKPATPATPATGNVIEEAEKQEPKKMIKESEPGSVVDDAPEPDQEEGEGDGNE